jgi:hypothetical protein
LQITATIHTQGSSSTIPGHACACTAQPVGKDMLLLVVQMSFYTRKGALQQLSAQTFCATLTLLTRICW